MQVKVYRYPGIPYKRWNNPCGHTIAEGATPEVYVDLMVIFMGPRLATGSSPLENFRNHLGKNIVNQPLLPQGWP